MPVKLPTKKKNDLNKAATACITAVNYLRFNLFIERVKNKNIKILLMTHFYYDMH